MTTEKSKLEEKTKSLPAAPGVYLMKDIKGRILYVGKALSLRNRVRSYFQHGQTRSPWVASLITRISDFDYLVTDSEKEALILEVNLIKHHRPHFNIRFKDDKRYPYLHMTVKDPFPRIHVVRAPLEEDRWVSGGMNAYFGPYSDSKAMRQTLRLMQQIFGIRTCRLPLKQGKVFRPCLLYHLKRCVAPCDGHLTLDEYQQVIRNVSLFLEGRQKELVGQLRERMSQAAELLEFERAARLRDQVSYLQRVVEEQKMVSTKGENLDVLGLAKQSGWWCIQVLRVRDGKLIGERHRLVSSAFPASEQTIIKAFLIQPHGLEGTMSRVILLPCVLEDASVISEWLSETMGNPVQVKVPRRGTKRRLVEVATRNAEVTLDRTLQDQKTQETVKEDLLRSLQEDLSLPNLPRRIEGFDISNLFGQQATGSMVVFEKGAPQKSEYRHFTMRATQGAPDDYAMFQEMLSRRFGKALSGAPGFAKMPDLLILDGGKGQLKSAMEVLAQFGLREISAAALAKEEELLFLPGASKPLRLPKDSASLLLLRHLRDEAHRFALTHHRQLRSRINRFSLLDEVPGLGPQRKRSLLRQFGSLKRVREASLEELLEVQGISRSVALALHDFLRRELDEG